MQEDNRDKKSGGAAAGSPLHRGLFVDVRGIVFPITSSSGTWRRRSRNAGEPPHQRLHRTPHRLRGAVGRRVGCWQVKRSYHRRRDRKRDLGRTDRANVDPDRTINPIDLHVAQPGCGKALAPRRVALATAERADIGDFRPLPGREFFYFTKKFWR